QPTNHAARGGVVDRESRAGSVRQRSLATTRVEAREQRGRNVEHAIPEQYVTAGASPGVDITRGNDHQAALPCFHHPAVAPERPDSAFDLADRVRFVIVTCEHAASTRRREGFDRSTGKATVAALSRHPRLHSRRKTPRRCINAVLAWRRSEERRVGKECRSRWSP